MSDEAEDSEFLRGLKRWAYTDRGLRDKFAIAALPALIEANIQYVDDVAGDAEERIARKEYEIADAMMKARKKPE